LINITFWSSCYHLEVNFSLFTEFGLWIGLLGVTIQDLKGTRAEYYGVQDKSGVLVASVVPGDPADQAGIQPNDIITKVGDKKINTSRDLTNLAAKLGVNPVRPLCLLIELGVGCQVSVFNFSFP